VHFFALGYPIVGDILYNQKKIKKAPLDRIFLHAAKLGFYNTENEWKEYESNLPAELNDFLKSLR
jgi:23S rRNA-/tRNA-specific pseudouridylate synthase